MIEIGKSYPVIGSKEMGGSYTATVVRKHLNKYIGHLNDHSSTLVHPWSDSVVVWDEAGVCLYHTFNSIDITWYSIDITPEPVVAANPLVGREYKTIFEDRSVEYHWDTYAAEDQYYDEEAIGYLVRKHDSDEDIAYLTPEEFKLGTPPKWSK